MPPLADLVGHAEKAKDRIIELVRGLGLSGFDLDELVGGIDNFWSDKAELIEIEAVDEQVDRAHRVFLAHVIIEPGCSVHGPPLQQSASSAAPQIAGNLNLRIAANRAFSHTLGHFRTHSSRFDCSRGRPRRERDDVVGGSRST